MKSCALEISSAVVRRAAVSSDVDECRMVYVSISKRRMAPVTFSVQLHVNNKFVCGPSISQMFFSVQGVCEVMLNEGCTVVNNSISDLTPRTVGGIHLWASVKEALLEPVVRQLEACKRFKTRAAVFIMVLKQSYRTLSAVHLETLRWKWRCLNRREEQMEVRKNLNPSWKTCCLLLRIIR